MAVRGRAVYTWCWITSSDFSRHYTFGEHSPLSAIFSFIIAMHDKNLVNEKATLSILDNLICHICVLHVDDDSYIYGEGDTISRGERKQVLSAFE